VQIKKDEGRTKKRGFIVQGGIEDKDRSLDAGRHLDEVNEVSM
jgi:hypothetical protein